MGQSVALIPSRVLVFPPVNNHRRFLVHKLVHEQFPDLSTFSIGDGDDRRPVVCFKRDYTPPEITKPRIAEERSPPKPVEGKRVERRSSTMPSIGIYRPPAARRLEEQTASPHEREQIADSINGRHDCKCPSEVDEIGKKSYPGSEPMFGNAIGTRNGTGKPKTAESDRKTESGGGRTRQRRPDMKMYVPKARRLAIEQGKGGKSEENGLGESTKSDVAVISERIEPKCVSGEIGESEKCDVRTVEIVKPESLTRPPERGRGIGSSAATTFWIEGENEVDGDEEKRVSSQPTGEVSSDGSSGPDSVVGSLEKICDRKDKSDCDWETMYDDRGECLDPSIIDQLSSAVGSVTIEKPKSNYDPFKMKTIDMVGNDFPHVIEIYNFPPEFRLQDLMTVFSQFKNSGFEIRWVDDTHALGIFSNSQIASEVLAFHHPFVKTRMLRDGTALSKEKARRSAEILLPYKPRPDTCPALARRLVTGALGVRLKTSREEREAERKILKEAREKKRLEAKQREEAWEGNFN